MKLDNIVSGNFLGFPSHAYGANVEFWLGPMEAGKTEDHLGYLNKRRLECIPTVLFGPEADERVLKDSRGLSMEQSRSGLSFPKIKKASINDADAMIEEARSRDPTVFRVFGFTEAHLWKHFPGHRVKNILGLAEKYCTAGNIKITIDGLDTTFTGELFPVGDSGRVITDLYRYGLGHPKSSGCHYFYLDKQGDWKSCGRPSLRTQRYLDGMPALRDSPLYSTGSGKVKWVKQEGEWYLENYVGVCPDHHFVAESRQDWREMSSRFSRYQFPQPVRIEAQDGNLSFVDVRQHKEYMWKEQPPQEEAKA